MGKAEADSPKVFLDIGLDREKPERLVFRLFRSTAPKTVENFVTLCNGSKGKGRKTGAKLHYKGSPLHRVIKGFMVQGGDTSKGNGTGGESIFGGTFDDEDFSRKHDKAGLLCMANRGPNTNGSQFYVTFAAAGHLDGTHTVFGELIDGDDVLRKIEEVEVDKKDRPKERIEIVDCGELLSDKDGEEAAATHEGEDKEEAASRENRSSSDDAEEDKKEVAADLEEGDEDKKSSRFTEQPTEEELRRIEERKRTKRSRESNEDSRSGSKWPDGVRRRGRGSFKFVTENEEDRGVTFRDRHGPDRAPPPPRLHRERPAYLVRRSASNGSGDRSDPRAGMRPDNREEKWQRGRHATDGVRRGPRDDDRRNREDDRRKREDAHAMSVDRPRRGRDTEAVADDADRDRDAKRSRRDGSGRRPREDAMDVGKEDNDVRPRRGDERHVERSRRHRPEEDGGDGRERNLDDRSPPRRPEPESGNERPRGKDDRSPPPRRRRRLEDESGDERERNNRDDKSPLRRRRRPEDDTADERERKKDERERKRGPRSPPRDDGSGKDGKPRSAREGRRPQERDRHDRRHKGSDDDSPPRRRRDSPSSRDDAKGRRKDHEDRGRDH